MPLPVSTVAVFFYFVEHFIDSVHFIACLLSCLLACFFVFLVYFLRFVLCVVSTRFCGKTHVRNDLLYVDRDAKFCSLTHFLLVII